MNSSVMHLMTPEHPLWEEFVERLEGPEGCNFKEDEKGNISWTCHGGTDKRFAARILKSMNREHKLNLDIDATLEYFGEYGGCCDCEILFNVGE